MAKRDRERQAIEQCGRAIGRAIEHDMNVMPTQEDLESLGLVDGPTSESLADLVEYEIWLAEREILDWIEGSGAAADDLEAAWWQHASEQA